MRSVFFFALLLFLASCSNTTFYITRHAEKAGTMTTDPPLTAKGERQAQALRDYLRNKNIRDVFSTNTLRTRSTVLPLAEAINLPVVLYSAADGAKLLDSLMHARTGNVLVVGHSNTVDDLVNHLMGKTVMQDLADSAYGDVFVVKKGKKVKFEKLKLPFL